MAASQIISQIRRKSSGGGYDTFYLGPEQRYVGALEKSNSNNLEEQLLMGVDRIIKTWTDTDTNTDRKTIEFRRDGDTAEYYVLEVYKYNGGSEKDDIYVRSGSLVLTSNFSVVGEELKEDDYDKHIAYNSSIEAMEITPNSVSEKEVLNYVKDDGSILEVSSKLTTSALEGNVVVTKEVITNYL